MNVLDVHSARAAGTSLDRHLCGALNRKVRVVLPYSLYLDGERSRGVGTYVRAHAHALAERGHEVWILTSGKGKPIRVLPNLTVVPVSEVEPFLASSQLCSPGFLFRRFRYMWRIWRFVRQYGADVLEASDGGFEHLFCLLFPGPKCVTRLHGNLTDHRTLMFAPVLDAIEWLVLRLSDVLAAPTRSAAEHIAEKYGFPLQRIVVVPDGVDLATGHKSIDVREKYGFEDKKIVLFAGALSVHKGIDLFVALARRFNRPEYADVVFVSTGMSDPAYAAGNLPDNYYPLGFIDRNEFSSFYDASNLFVSTSRHETFGYTTVEALSFGLQVLVSDCIGTRDVVEPGRGATLFKSGDLEDLCEKFKMLWERDRLLKTSYPENVARAKCFDVRTAVLAMEGLYSR
jgi:glycosyltransferase involved in cell wall biosynthesis